VQRLLQRCGLRRRPQEVHGKEGDPGRAGKEGGREGEAAEREGGEILQRAAGSWRGGGGIWERGRVSGETTRGIASVVSM
jgi:hypothetical protein